MFTALYEDMLGKDPFNLWYPGISSCMAVALKLDPGGLVGAHLTVITPWAQVVDTFEGMMGMVDGRQITQMYLIGRRATWREYQQGGDDRFDALIDLVQGVSNCYEIYSYDTAEIATTTDVHIMNGGEYYLNIMVYKGGINKFDGLPLEEGMQEPNVIKARVNFFGDYTFSPETVHSFLRRPLAHERAVIGKFTHVTQDKLERH